MRLIKRELGIGRLEDPPTFLFRYQPGPATLAALFSLEGRGFRMVVSEGEVIDGLELPGARDALWAVLPDAGVRACLDGWLCNGAPHHQVMNFGRHAGAWRAFCELGEIELVLV